ncbi:hypothetical protein NY2A_b030L [Paramecium bursaria Chlorella virus NY2A]|uniref:Uncharacterized protein b030L n=1 Tax=Paramecium bursaria Chlorella virus NY2A TaxID=46021 RepID=A7IVQ5_PBCVN|nr:hypothetical protein NY2A_b030L [Paramecium bursaria Chlorella virus NY2A]ABT14429.1 hypothetical protein NY2A_b030L [Paramecium bursaria Chlorella virus NY2A]
MWTLITTAHSIVIRVTTSLCCLLVLTYLMIGRISIQHIFLQVERVNLKCLIAMVRNSTICIIAIFLLFLMTVKHMLTNSCT